MAELKLSRFRRIDQVVLWCATYQSGSIEGMTKWEYQVTVPEVEKREDIELYLSQQGDEGWELTSVLRTKLDPMRIDVETDQYTFFFKRPK
jgi:hypothetical protein